ncbi:MAG: hypothetical protein K2H38_07100 [Muribaculaceae bacterium]|nr:hypothetical protein [Muribaculaceae bacterium]MDE6552152.1 hypothetical protein [Muribaculaceae bacterium]MDE7350906.1 hypothetical protein [Muribaculaceae bacterium]
MDTRLALSSLIALTNENLGFSPSTPSEFNDASLKIQSATGKSISQSSLKRLWGYVHYSSKPSTTTLNNLAQFNGFSDWKAYVMSLSPEGMDDDSGFLEDSLLDTGRLATGDRLALSWNDGKECLMECIAPGRFRIEMSKNIKLQEGDTLTLHMLGIGHPIYANDIVRGGERIPAYHGAKKGGLLSFRILHG